MANKSLNYLPNKQKNRDFFSPLLAFLITHTLKWAAIGIILSQCVLIRNIMSMNAFSTGSNVYTNEPDSSSYDTLTYLLHILHSSVGNLSTLFLAYWTTGCLVFLLGI